MYKRTLFALAIVASVAIAQPPVPRPVCMTLTAQTPRDVAINQGLVRAEVTIVCIHPETMRSLELWDDTNGLGQKCNLSRCQANRMLEIIKADERCEVLASPQLLMMDSQSGTVSTRLNTAEINLMLIPRLSLDHKFIQMAVALGHEQLSVVQEKPANCKEDPDSFTYRTRRAETHELNSIVTVPTGNSVVLETRVFRPVSHCSLTPARFAEAVSQPQDSHQPPCANCTKHICVIITPTEVNSTCCAQPMPPMQAECVAPCQVFMPAPPMMAMPPMMVMPPMPCDPTMPGCCVPNAAFAFVPAQEQTERATPRTSNRTLEKLLDKYEDACANGDLDKARKLARRCLDIDPTCFMQDR